VINVATAAFEAAVLAPVLEDKSIVVFANGPPEKAIKALSTCVDVIEFSEKSQLVPNDNAAHAVVASKSSALELQYR